MSSLRDFIFGFTVVLYILTLMLPGLGLRLIIGEESACFSCASIWPGANARGIYFVIDVFLFASVIKFSPAPVKARLRCEMTFSFRLFENESVYYSGFEGDYWGGPGMF